EDDLLIALTAMATGKRSLLKDDKEEDGKRKPDLEWFKELRELIQGKSPDRTITTQEQDEPDLSPEELDARISAYSAHRKAKGESNSSGVRGGSEQGEMEGGGPSQPSQQE